ncbi:hypothetical protein [Ornithinimicrobium panacihumi]|uniref:hypothetical protein n=1 Tax=Ornithinimicrobium panacihumi TaxID=2008449 RepID=UPI003F8C8318
MVEESVDAGDEGECLVEDLDLWQRARKLQLGDHPVGMGLSPALPGRVGEIENLLRPDLAGPALLRVQLGADLLEADLPLAKRLIECRQCVRHPPGPEDVGDRAGHRGEAKAFGGGERDRPGVAVVDGDVREPARAGEAVDLDDVHLGRGRDDDGQVVEERRAVVAGGGPWVGAERLVEPTEVVGAD